ncbi:hypothetical protein U5640_01255 [Streptomyces sp. SS7]|uniref:hypothetical protein n=1 Tax=Streptomyces sp. SS7 TaxID=3108485 RepID=UPI0030EF8E7F
MTVLAVPAPGDADAAQHLPLRDEPELEMAMAHHGPAPAGALAVAVTTGIHPDGHCTALPPEQRPHRTLDGVGALLDLLPVTA